MNYFSMLNRFWEFRVFAGCVTSVQADIYYYLLNIANQRKFPQQLPIKNMAICSVLGITEKTLITNRDALVCYGLISVVAGKKNESSPLYTILDYCIDYSKTYSKGENKPYSKAYSKEESKIENNEPDNCNNYSKAYSKEESKPYSIYNNTSNNANNNANENNTLPNGSGPDEKKEENFKGGKVEHWQAIVDTWFKLYEEWYKEKPTFNGVAQKALKDIIKSLYNSYKTSDNEKAKAQEWTEQYAVACFSYFLTLARKDNWLKQNFLLHNLSKQYDAIIQSRRKKEDGAISADEYRKQKIAGGLPVYNEGEE